ncbi:DUF4132 domain-containing protein [Psychroserpens sp. NJDZ02]|uniref:DUF4132 domain-containing protein n=1 Tax=Psychroserpens sp. NJDZ02 TaxID=2570561 RepID=UPI0010A9403A|nr:DUF4132 domain-containing protein [Psychroserpens sp. NJDZ02]QCE41810.1 DUF4132 domain-containing protein [Psychroserpens sp. NJDZ02]
MIPVEDAKKYIEKHKKPEVDRFEFRQFSEPYRVLGKILGRIDKDKRVYYNSNDFITVFDDAITVNPWRTQEGMRLGMQLYGIIQTPYLADMWDFMDTLPYQRNYNRKAFRSVKTKDTLRNKLQFLTSFLQLSRTGYGGLTLHEHFQFSTYFQGSNSYFLATLLHNGNGVFDELLDDIIQNEDEIGGISADIIKALLLSEDEKHWKMVGKLLLAAQRQEGLRQTILESLDVSNLGALKYMITIVLENDLARFTSVNRAVCTWFGLKWETPKKAVINRVLELAQSLILNSEDVDTLLKSKDNLEVLVALWSIAIIDVDKANAKALDIVYTSEDRNKKILALYFIHTTDKTNQSLVEYFKKELGKDYALDHWMAVNLPLTTLDNDTFIKLFEVAKTAEDKGKTFESKIFSWWSFTPSSYYFYQFLINGANEEQLELIANDLDLLPTEFRESYIRKVFPKDYSYSFYNYEQDAKKKDRLNYDENSWKRALARKAIYNRNELLMATGLNLFSRMHLYDKDLEIAEDLLRRKHKSLRTSLIKLLVELPADRLRTSATNLVTAKSIDQRIAGLELLTLLHDGNKQSNFVEDQIRLYNERPKITKNEQVYLDKFTDNADEFDFSNGFGAIDYDNLTPLYIPESRFEKKTSFFDKLGITTSESSGFKFKDFIDANKIIKEVNKLIDSVTKNGNHEYQTQLYKGEIATTYIDKGIRDIKNLEKDATPEELLHNLPLAKVWITWYEQSKLNDFEMYAAIRYIINHESPFGAYKDFESFARQYYPDLSGLKLDKENRYNSKSDAYNKILIRLFNVYAEKRVIANFKLDMMEDMIANFPKKLKSIKFQTSNYRYNKKTFNWTNVILPLTPSLSIDNLELLTEAQLQKYWGTYMYLIAQDIVYPNTTDDVKVITKQFRRPGIVPFPSIAVTLRLYKKGLLNDDDLRFQALHSRELMVLMDGGYNSRINYKWLEKDSVPKHVFSALKTNLLETELERGDLETTATGYMNGIHCVEGVDYVFRILERLGKDNFERGYSYYGDSKKTIFSGLLKKSRLKDTESYADFAARADASKVTKKRLIELACYATQWTGIIGEYLGLEKLEDAVWWFQAHASDYMNSEKETIISRYSNIPKSDFALGAIDVDWFNKVYKTIGKTNWKLLHDAAKYITDGNGHRQVKLYSSVMLGEVKITETLKKIKDKRDKDYVRALGLIPLSKTIPEKDLLKRYNLLQDFLKESKQFGAQRQESEATAVEIGLDNLSRTAGYQDRVRFSWAMEAKATQTIMKNAVITIEETVIELVINDLGKTEFKVTKAGKSLKNIPAKLNKDKQVIALKENKTYLSRQYSRTRLSLENAMVNEDEFTAQEIHNMMQHPIVKVMLSKLVMFVPEKEISGFYNEGILTDATGKKHQLAEDDVLLIAHASHLYKAVEWDMYQKYLFAERLVQPFKQVFRELYLITDDEREHSTRSERYQGHQIQPKKTVALLRGRGWTVSMEEGLQKVYHKRGFIATMYAMADWYSPSEAEAPTLEDVCFHSVDTYQRIPLTEIPSVVFSEIMRDVDLVVSVAHVGGVDPEASHSTMQMRAALAEESARLFKLKNITVKERFVFIKGTFGEYSIHLGSGQVSKNGLALSIIPVHSQHRGRMFLPFVDDDPKSAEIISKMKLLSEDNKIQDPTILAQINS